MKHLTYENITLTLISVGLPLIALLYLSWKEVIASAIIIQIIIGLLYVRNN